MIFAAARFAAGVAVMALAIGAVALGAPPAEAGPAEEYIAARAAAAAKVAEAEKAGKSQAQIDRLDAAGRKDLAKRMAALLGPLRFKGLGGTPSFSPDTLIATDMGADSPDGLVFRNGAATTTLLASPEPVFADWLKARAADQGAPAAFKDGIGKAARDDFFFTLTVSRDAAFSTYTPLAVAPAGGEEIHAALGLFTQDISGDTPPDSVVALRIADGRVLVAGTQVKLKLPPMPACAALWKDGSARADALLDAARKTDEPDDPRVEESFRMQDAAAAAFRACFARQIAGTPALAEAVRTAEGLLGMMRGR